MGQIYVETNIISYLCYGAQASDFYWHAFATNKQVLKVKWDRGEKDIVFVISK